MGLLNWDGINKNSESDYSLRDVVENMRKLGALIEIVGTVVVVTSGEARYDEATAEELVQEAGALLEQLGDRALELLDAQGAPNVPTPILSPRVRSAKRRAA